MAMSRDNATKRDKEYEEIQNALGDLMTRHQGLGDMYNELVDDAQALVTFMSILANSMFYSITGIQEIDAVMEYKDIPPWLNTQTTTEDLTVAYNTLAGFLRELRKGGKPSMILQVWLDSQVKKNKKGRLII